MWRYWLICFMGEEMNGSCVRRDMRLADTMVISIENFQAATVSRHIIAPQAIYLSIHPHNLLLNCLHSCSFPKQAFPVAICFSPSSPYEYHMAFCLNLHPNKLIIFRDVGFPGFTGGQLHNVDLCISLIYVEHRRGLSILSMKPPRSPDHRRILPTR